MAEGGDNLSPAAVFALSPLAETHRALELMKANPTVTSRDAIHAATMIKNAVKEIISIDSHFDLIPGIKRIDPGKFS